MTKMMYLFVVLISTVSAYNLTCPHLSQWRKRAVDVCSNVESYVCLWDEIDDVYKERCTGPRPQQEGYKTVLNTGNFNRQPCAQRNFQPIQFPTIGTKECIYQKSLCNGEGQVYGNKGSITQDRGCRCDYTRGYAFVNRNTHPCYCVPSKEDCSCYIKTCEEGNMLSPDYICTNDIDPHQNSTCPVFLVADDRCKKIGKQNVCRNLTQNMSDMESDFSDDYQQDIRTASDDEWPNDRSSGPSSANGSPDISPLPTDDEMDENEDVFDYVPNWAETYEEIDIGPFIENTGPSHDLAPGASELEHFKLFFTDAMIDKIVSETNLYAAQNGPDPLWNDTTREEISAYIGMQIMMGIVRVPDYSFYWSNNKFLGNQGFKEIMSVKRYEKISQYIHVNDIETDVPVGQPGHDKLHKIRPLIDSSLQTFSDRYKPNKSQSVDEAMVSYKGRFSAKQYIPSKPTKWGFKIWMRCDSKSGYCHQYDIYMGKETGVNNRKGLGHRVVERLTAELRNKNHHIYFDSFFTSIPLVKDLLRNGIYGCGTIRQNRKGFPQDLREAPRLQTGQFVGRQTEDMVSVVWMDNKNVSVLASNESLTEVDTTNRRQKDGTNLRITRPRVISNYQEHFRGVDICDQLRTKYAIGRPSKKWWKYLLNFIIDLCIINSFIVMSEGPQIARARKRYKQLDFRLNLSAQLIANFTARPRGAANVPVRRPNLVRLSHAHVKLGRKRSTCKLCTKVGEKRRKTTQFGCEKCDKHLCSLQCHNTFHTDIGITVVTEE